MRGERATGSSAAPKGIKAEGDGCEGSVAGVPLRKPGAWHARKHGGAKRRSWRKFPIGVDERTQEIRAIVGEQANATGWRELANGSSVGDPSNGCAQSTGTSRWQGWAA